jgi:GNAT superfamily N-acetyltransferase
MLEFKQLTLAENEKRLIALLSEQQEAEKKVPAEENTSFSCALYEDGHYIGGITANKWMNTTHISLLALNKEARLKGYGTKLLLQIAALARLLFIRRTIRPKPFTKNLAIVCLGN